MRDRGTPAPWYNRRIAIQLAHIQAACTLLNRTNRMFIHSRLQLSSFVGRFDCSKQPLCSPPPNAQKTNAAACRIILCRRPRFLCKLSWSYRAFISIRGAIRGAHTRAARAGHAPRDATPRSCPRDPAPRRPPPRSTRRRGQLLPPRCALHRTSPSWSCCAR